MTTTSKILGVLRDTTGQILPQRIVLVYNTGTNTLSTLYQDDGTTSMPNPFFTGLDGSYGFNAAVAAYDLKFLVDAATTVLFTNVPCGGGSGGGGGVTSVNGLTGAVTLPAFVAAGSSHAAGQVPDPGATASPLKYLGNDAAWHTLSTGSGIPYSPLDMNYGYNPSGGAYSSGSDTVGQQFYPTAAGVTITGARIFAAGAMSLTVNLWNEAGSIIATGTASPSGAGILTCTFGSAYTTTSNDVGAKFTISYYDSTNHYTQWTGPSRDFPAMDNTTGYYWPSISCYASGNSYPTTVNAAGAYFFGIEPTF